METDKEGFVYDTETMAVVLEIPIGSEVEGAGNNISFGTKEEAIAFGLIFKDHTP